MMQGIVGYSQKYHYISTMLTFPALGMVEFALLSSPGEFPTLLTDSGENTVRFRALVMNKASSIAAITAPAVHFNFALHLTDSEELISDSPDVLSGTYHDIDTVNDVTDIRSKELASREVVGFADSSVDLTFNSAACIGVLKFSLLKLL